MASVPGKRVSWRKRLLFWLPCVAFILVALEFLAIHPVSSFLGGLFYLLFGAWVVPSAVNILLAVWIALLPPVRWALRILLGVLASFVLGVNTSLPALFHLGGLPPADIVVIRPLPVTHSLAVDTRMVVTNTGVPDDQVLAPPGVHVGGDEGCGCMYWVPNSKAYPYQIQKLIDARAFSDVIGQYQFSDQLPNVSPYNKIVHFTISFAPSSAQRDDLLDMTVNVYQGHDKVASYRQRRLPVETEVSLGRYGKLLNGHFVANVWSTLIHQGFWATLLRSRLRQDAYAGPFRTFLERALPAAANGTPSTVGAEAGVSATVLLPQVIQPTPDLGVIVKTLKITTEKGSAVDWVTVSAKPFAIGQACPSQGAANIHNAVGASPREQNLAASREDDGSFEARLVTGALFETQRCQQSMDVTVKFYSKGAVVGEASVGEDLFRGGGVYRGICVSERVDYSGAKPDYFPICFRKGLNASEDQNRERIVRSFAWNHVFDAEVALESH